MPTPPPTGISALPGNANSWTLADFMSTYRFWALFAASLFVMSGVQGLHAVFPSLLSAAGASYAVIGAYFVWVQAGWVLGAATAFIAVTRCARAPLLVPLAICASMTAASLLIPGFLSNPALFSLLGISIGAVQTVFGFAAAIFLVGGRPAKIDFAGALVVVGGPALIAFLGSIGASRLVSADPNGQLVILGLLGCLLCAGLALAPCRRLAFDDAPRLRHKPLEPTRRSPWLVFLAAALPLVGMAVALVVSALQSFSVFGATSFDSFATQPLTMVAGLLFGAWLVFTAYWLYHVHGELAGAEASQHLFTPVPPIFIALLVPLGMPVILMTLGELLNDRARAAGRKQALSITGLAISSLVFPPLAMTIIQNAANRSYAA